MNKIPKLKSQKRSEEKDRESEGSDGSASSTVESSNAERTQAFAH